MYKQNLLTRAFKLSENFPNFRFNPIICLLRRLQGCLRYIHTYLIFLKILSLSLFMRPNLRHFTNNGNQPPTRCNSRLMIFFLRRISPEKTEAQWAFVLNKLNINSINARGRLDLKDFSSALVSVIERNHSRESATWVTVRLRWRVCCKS